ncbi:P-loop containing nucleoside triphosphate hydrolases superfamily protein isoform X2 [Carex rostrata]
MTHTTGEKEKELQMERIYVAVRVRPLLPEESKSVPWQINANSISLPNQSQKFEFDRIFSENCKNKDVYEARTQDIVASAVSGFNGTVFAYGQTSSGKTHTMKGSNAEPGIIPLAIQDLFHTIQETGDREFLLRVSYMEIYNEEINDLLAPEHRKLQIHENIERGIYVAGLKEEIVNCPEQVLDLMKFGESHRHIGETNMNLYSSRSHTIFRMIIESREKLEDTELNDSCDAVRVSVLNLVDLAGSERVAKTGAEGKRLKEGSHINKSLLTLGSVIQKLSEGAQNQGGHVPYRDSKLTRILQPALGGNANTAIICNITLAQIHADETKSSLQFASKAKRVTNCAQVNEIVTDAALLKRQKKMIEELQAKLDVSHNEEWEEQILTLRNTLLQSELEKERISLELEEEKKAKAQREERLLEQARKIENLSSLVLLSDRDEKTAPSLKSQKKRRVTWCPAHSATQDVAEDTSKSHRASSGAALVPFETLMEEDESFLDELENRNTGEIPFPDALSLLNVTSRRKINSKENNEKIEYCSSSEKSNEQVGTPGRSKIQSLTLRESEAILIIKQLEDQNKLLELEKASTQNDLDNVLKLATQQNNSFTKKYEEMQQEVVKAHEEARIAQEKVSLAKSFEETSLENVGPIHVEVLEAVQGLELLVGQSKHSTDGLVSFVEELFQNFSTLSKMLQEVKSSADGDILEFKTVLSESEMLTIQLSGKAKDLNLEKRLLEGQLIDCQNENEKLKCVINSSEKTMAEVKEQHEFEKQELCNQLVMMQNEIAVLSSSSLIREIESLSESEMITIQMSGKAKDLNIEKSHLEGQLKDCQNEIDKLKCDVNSREKTMDNLLQGQLIDCQSQMEYLKCDINIREKTMASLLKGQLIDCQNEMEKLKCDIKDREKIMDEMNEQHQLEREELCKKLVLMQNEIAVLSSSLIREIESLSESEMLTIQLSGKAKDLNFEKSLLEGQLIDCQRENEKLKCDINSREKIIASFLEGQLNDSQTEIENLKCDINIREKTMASLLKGQFIGCQSEMEKIKCDIKDREKTMDEMKEQHELEKEELCTQLVMMQNEIAILSSSSLIREIESLRKELDRIKTRLKDTEAKLKTSIHEKIKLEGEKVQAAKEIKELTNKRALLERDIRKQESKHESKLTREYQNLQMHAVEMERELASLEETLMNTIAEKEEALTRLDIVTSELEELSKIMSSTESEIGSLKDEVANKAQKLKEAESSIQSLESCCESSQKEKEELEMQLTNALLEAEMQKSMCLSKERTIIQVIEQTKISGKEIQRLSKDLSEAELKLEAYREENKLLKKSSDDMISQLKTEKDNLMANITALESKIRDDLQCQLVAITEEKDALRCTNEKMRLEINEGEILRQSSDRMVLNAKMERDELATRISSMEAKMLDDKLRYETELTNCQSRYCSTQEKLDEYKKKCVILDKKHKIMHQKFTEASDELKNKLRTYGLEILKLKKELANIKGSSSGGCASTSAQ